MFVTDKLQMPLPPRTGSHWVDMVMRYLNIPCSTIGGKHRIPEKGDPWWKFIPDGLKRFTIVREPEPWLRSIYRTVYPVKGHMGILPLKEIVEIDASSEEEFVERSLHKVSAMWEYYQPADFVARTETLAEDFIKVLLGVGYKLTKTQQKKLRGWPPENDS